MSPIDTHTILDRGVVIVRLFDAPRDLVWSAWSDPEHLKQWWGPDGFTNTFSEFDFRTGGHWRFVMHGPGNMDFENHNVFVEVRKPELIVIDHLVHPLFRVTATFEEMGDKTKLTFEQIFDTEQTFQSVKAYSIPGAQQTLGRLGRLLHALGGN